MMTGMTICERHGKAITTAPVCPHIYRKIKEDIKPEKVFNVWFCGESNKYPWWALHYCDECGDKNGFIRENQKYFGNDAKVKCDEMEKKAKFTSGVCEKCFVEFVGKIEF